jgi:hypothetical protein
MKAARLKLLFALLFAWCVSACTSASAPPAPIAEIPSAVSFPEDVSIDLSALGGETPASSVLPIKLQASGPFSDAIALGPVIIAMANDLLEVLLQPLQSLEIPVSPQVRTFEGLINIPNVLPQKLKVDFAAFDFDGDGILEGTGCTCPVGCSGNSCPAEAPLADLQPIVYRIWIQNPDGSFVRFMAGRFDLLRIKDDPDTPGNEENPGKGRFRAGIEGQPGESPGSNEDLFFGVIYDHRDFSDPLRKTTELFVQDKQFDSGGNQISFDNFHSQAEQKTSQLTGIPDALQKTAKLSAQVLPVPTDNFSDIQYIGRFLEDFDFWSGSFVITGNEASVPKTVSGQNICARISTGDETARGNCIDLGIDVAGEAFLVPTSQADVAFPADFPLLPTF